MATAAARFQAVTARAMRASRLAPIMLTAQGVAFARGTTLATSTGDPARPQPEPEPRLPPAPLVNSSEFAHASLNGVPPSSGGGGVPRSVGVEQLEYGSHRLERGQRARPEQHLDLREASGAELPDSVGDLLG